MEQGKTYNPALNALAGARMDSPQVAPMQHTIGDSLNNMHNALASLDDALGDLVRRIDPVLKPECTASAQGIEKPISLPRSSVEVELDAQSEKVWRLVNAINDIRDRVAL